MTLAALSVDDFAARLGSNEPTPGGGAAAALVAKLAAALVQMVANHTLGRPKYAAVEERMRAIAAEAERLGRRAGELMDADAEAFAGVTAAFKLPQVDIARPAAIGAACQVATEVPLEVLRMAAGVAGLAGEVARTGNHTLASDAYAALSAARAAAEMSIGNVRANRPFIPDHSWADRAAAEAAELLAGIGELCQGAQAGG